MQGFICYLCFVLSAFAWPVAGAQTADAGDMQRLYQSMRPRMAQTPFQRALALDSTEAAGRTSGDIYAVMDIALANLELVNRDPQRWCEILLLLSNAKNCAVGAADGAAALLLRMGTKGPQELGGTTPLSFRFATSAAQTPVLETRLNSDDGPMGTKEGVLSLRAIALGADKSFVHLHYSYRSSLAGRIATEVYLQTLGRGKVGFSTEKAPPETAGPRTESPFVGGVRGIIERNTMRYFLGLGCALQFASTKAPERRFGLMAPCWYDETERYPVQLHEMPRQDYLTMKQQEYAREAPKN
jgi:hypothetical protein